MDAAAVLGEVVKRSRREHNLELAAFASQLSKALKRPILASEVLAWERGAVVPEGDVLAALLVNAKDRELRRHKLLQRIPKAMTATEAGKWVDREGEWIRNMEKAGRLQRVSDKPRRYRFEDIEAIRLEMQEARRAREEARRPGASS